MARVLVVDDEKSLRLLLSSLLTTQGHDVTVACSGDEAIAVLNDDAPFDLTLSDVRMAPGDGMKVLSYARENFPDMAVVMLTAFSTVETAVEALNNGAFDYVAKPFQVPALLDTVASALEYHNALADKNTQKRIEADYHLANIIAESSAMKAACETIQKVAPTTMVVIIYGETGSGKEMVARAIHTAGPRKNQPFLTHNCATVPEPIQELLLFGAAEPGEAGLFEQANGGTLYLEEIDAMPDGLQETFLALLRREPVCRPGSTKPLAVDIRILASANNTLEELLERKMIRRDLYARLSSISIQIPPLRERPEDILPVANDILRAATPDDKEPPHLDAEVCDIFLSYNWPGNVQQLCNVVRGAISQAVDGIITTAALPERIATTPISRSMPSHADTHGAKRGQIAKAWIRAHTKKS